ncbi:MULTISPECIES: potassium channel family protein [Bacillaceae]|uniref:potassium channel family protein n=1 Tax=Bacillaceae TaxID=186817 RepID=UPI001F247ADB|nr:potassium channel family protein [Litchfieldia alkalitelluris]
MNHLNKENGLTPPKKSKLLLIYEVFMAILALTSVIFIFNHAENSFIRNLDFVIWIIFVVDVLTRLILSKNKIEYLKKNPLDIIAIIPFDSIFRLARLARIIRLFRAIAIMKHILGPVYAIIRTNNLDKVVLGTVILIFISSIPIRFVEPSINSYTDAVWWAIVTSTTVGYGDISPETMIGRLIAIVLMIFGIGLLGMVTSSVASYFLKKKESDSESPTIAYIKGEVDRIEELTEVEIERLKLLLDTYKKDFSDNR